MNRPAFPSLPDRRCGAALIITLFFLVIISVLIFGFLDAARVDRTTSSSHFERTRAANFARAGIEATVATLRRETGDPPASPNDPAYFPRNWISQPGAISITSGADKTRLTTQVRLHSGYPTAEFLAKLKAHNADALLRPPDLNASLLADPTKHLIVENVESGDATGSPAENQGVLMQVRWVYVRQDGTYELDNLGDPLEEPDLTKISNPIVGRFAYWADDESAKVNYNLAWRNDSINLAVAGSPTKVDLTVLPQFTSNAANKVHSFVTPDNYYGALPNQNGSPLFRFFNTPFDARLIDDESARNAIEFNKFNLTHYNSDPDTTYYGRPRMMLTTNPEYAKVRDGAGNPVLDRNRNPVMRPFLDILTSPTVDPGNTSGAVDAVKLDKVVKELVNNYLKRSDWPVVTGEGHSIQEKYYSGLNYVGSARDLRLAQLGLNIIDYVRSAESSRPVVRPLRAKWLDGVFTPDFANSNVVGTSDTFKGVVRSPYITEMGMWVSDTPEPVGIPNAGRYRTIGFVEIFVPLNYGITSLDLMGTANDKGVKESWTVYFQEFGKGIYYRADGSTLAGAGDFAVLNPRAPGTSPAYVYDAANENLAIVRSAASKTKMGAGQYRTIAIEAWRNGPRTGAATMRAAITLAGGGRIDVAPLSGGVSYTFDSLKAVNEIASIEVADPRVNGLTNDWRRVGRNTFSRENTRWQETVGKPSSEDSKIPPQDLDKDSNVTIASFRMPVPKDLTKPTTTGKVRSAGELGLVHTGIEGSDSPIARGIPFRSLHLQPTFTNTKDTIVVPDWAFMDLFTVPVDVPKAAAAIFSPHGNSAGGRINVNANPEPFQFDRIDPLTAALMGVRRSRNTTTTLDLRDARDIAKNIYKHNLAAFGKAYPAVTPSAGNKPPLVVYESPGEVAEIKGVADGGEESEQLLSDLSNVITARGNVFSVYTVGQALKQTATGKLVVTGEQRQQAMVERYTVSKNTGDVDDDEIRFRTVYLRNLSP